jgi:hypothetical protein
MLNWNNAPLARENWDIIEVDPLANPGYPGVPRTWNVSGAVAEAYASGEPLRLVFYSADSDMHSGRYFYSSDYADAAVRPTLVVTWGDSVGRLSKSVWPVVAAQGDRVTYTLALLATGRAMTLTDDLPIGVSVPLQINATKGVATFDAASRRVTWIGNVDIGQPVTITFPVTILIAVPTAVINETTLTDTLLGESTASAIFIANSVSIWLPLMRK